jgi:preprotein translocase subunit SecA
MGLFGKKEEPNHLGDRVFVNRRQKHDHLMADALQYLKEGKWVLLSYFFNDTGTYLSSLLKDKEIEFNELDNVRPEMENKINMVQAESFLTQYFRERLSPGTKEVVILFAEHYPLFKTEEKLLRSLESFGSHASFFFYNSFDDPLLTRFAALKTDELIKNLGIKEDEMISSFLITKAIARVQKKLEAKVRFELKAFSMEDWFENNLRTIDQYGK